MLRLYGGAGAACAEIIGFSLTDAFPQPVGRYFFISFSFILMSAPISLLEGQSTDVPVQQYVGIKEAFEIIHRHVAGSMLCGITTVLLGGDNDDEFIQSIKKHTLLRGRQEIIDATNAMLQFHFKDQYRVSL